MAFSPIGLVLGSVLAEREGVTNPQARTRLALLGGFLGYHSPVTGLVLTTVLARREAESESAPAESAPALSLAQIPNVEGRNITEAQQELEAFGLKVLSTDGRSSTLPGGSVISQDPPAFSLVLEGAAVTLAVSRAFELPDVTHKPIADAKAQLESLGLQVRRRSQNSSRVPKGSVIAQDPTAGTLVSPNDTVSLTISKGRRKVSLVELPDLIGQPFREAREELQDLGLKVKHISVASPKAPDEVVDQEPKAGKVEAGSQVKLSLSNGSRF